MIVVTELQIQNMIEIIETHKQKGFIGPADQTYAIYILSHMVDMAREPSASVQMLENVRQKHCIDVEL